MASILLIRGGAAGSVAADLTAMGHTVTETTATTEADLNTAWGAGKDLIALVSSESNGPFPWVKAKWQAGVPILFGAYWTSQAYGPRFGLAQNEASTNGQHTTVTISGSHPIVAGFSGDVAVTTGDLFYYMSRLTSGALGSLSGYAIDGHALSAWDVGDALRFDGAAPDSPGATAPARAVFMGWLQRSATLTLSGQTLLGQAVSWLGSAAAAAPAAAFIGWGIPRAASAPSGGAPSGGAPVWVVETRRTPVAVTGPTTLTFASTPQPGDVIAVQYACHRSSSVRVLSSISGMGGTWVQAFNSGVGQSTWVGTGMTSAGSITLTQNAAASMTAEARLIRGLTSTAASGVWADLGSGAPSTLSRTAGKGQIVLGYFHGFDATATLSPTTYPVSTDPASDWVFTTQVDNGTVAWRSGLFIPRDAAATRSIVGDNTGSGDTVQHSLVVLGTAS